MSEPPPSSPRTPGWRLAAYIVGGVVFGGLLLKIGLAGETVLLALAALALVGIGVVIRLSILAQPAQPSPSPVWRRPLLWPLAYTLAACGVTWGLFGFGRDAFDYAALLGLVLSGAAGLGGLIALCLPVLARHRWGLLAAVLTALIAAPLILVNCFIAGLVNYGG